MELLIVRHAPAKDSFKWLQRNGTDETRPLTRKGIRKMKRAAQGLHTLVEQLDVLLSSPYERAAHTAKLLQDVYKTPITYDDNLIPDALPRQSFASLAKYDNDARIAIVGHETGLSELLSILTGHEDAFMYFSKGGAALLHSDTPSTPGSYQLKWLVTRKLLEKLAPTDT